MLWNDAAMPAQGSKLAILFLPPRHHLQRTIRQRPLQRQCFRDQRRQPGLDLSLRRQNHRNRLRMNGAHLGIRLAGQRNSSYLGPEFLEFQASILLVSRIGLDCLLIPIWPQASEPRFEACSVIQIIVFVAFFRCEGVIDNFFGHCYLVVGKVAKFLFASTLAQGAIVLRDEADEQ